MLAFTLAFTTCAATAQEPVRIGVISSITGPIAFVGISHKNSLALLPAKIGGSDVSYIFYDDASDPTQTVRLVKKLLTEDKIDALLGPSGSPNAIAAIPFVAAATTPMLAVVGTQAAVLPMDDQK
ncbi:MAG: branched-chain amino acid ABC transporter substrate-binding protein, partial [Pusillimonas sp.]